MAKEDIIKVATEPRIPIKELWSADDSDVSGQNTQFVAPKSNRSGKEKIGSDVPYIKINSVPIRKIEYMSLDETGIIPKIKVIFTDDTGAISGPNYPKNDPILSLYIKTQNPNFKPIRCDFLITTIRTNQDAFTNKDNIGSGATFIMSGEMYIPKIYDNLSRSYKDMNSKDAMKAIAEQMDLGFADNTFTPNDQMTWINTNKSTLKFIDQVTRHSYMNDDSFFTSFIDKYYHLTFINIAEQLSPKHEINYTYENTVDASQVAPTQKMAEDQNTEMFDILAFVGLTNKDTNKGKPEYIINYSLMGDTGRLLKNKGFKKKIYYYDHILEDDKFTSFYVNPIKIKGYTPDGRNPGLVPGDETLKESTVKKWMNIDYGNTHREWNASVLINDHNNSELNKVKLKVETAGINFGITRGSGIPVAIFNTGAQKSSRDANRNDTNLDGESDTKVDSDSITVDDVLTGRYYVSGVKYIYDALDENFKYKTEFQLARVNWLDENKITE